MSTFREQTKNMNRLFTFLLVSLGLTTSAFSQDTTIFSHPYMVTYSKKLKAPLLVTYLLYKGGGECSRANFHFKPTSFSATSADYMYSGYDKGHLCNSEDFAYDCELDERTFRY